MERGEGPDALPARVLVVDDQHVARWGTVQVLTDRGLTLLPPIDDVRGLAAAVHEGQPDLVVIETAMGDRGLTITTLATVLVAHPHLRVLAFSADLSPVTVEAALDAGCLGVVPKTATADALLAAVIDVARGERHLHPRAIAALLQRRQAVETLRSMRALSERELAVLVRIAEGRSNLDIAGDLGVSEATVKTHVAHLLRKLQAHDRAHAVSRGMRLGLFA